MSHSSHTSFVEGCFACKVKTLNFGMVPGGYKSTTSQTYYDEEALPNFPTKEEVMDVRSDLKRVPVKEVKVDV